MKKLFLLVAVAAGPLILTAQTITTYDVTGATGGTFPGPINRGGTVVGEYINSTGFHGFLRAPDGTITSFNPPADSLTSGTTTPFALNNLGAVVGIYTHGIVEFGFLRDPLGNFTDIAPPGSTLTEAFSINDSGVIAGSWVDSAFPRKAHGFVRDSAGNYTSFDMPLAVQPTKGVVVASINSSGQIAGMYSDAAFHNHGFVRDSAGAITTFDAPAGFTNVQVYSMNDNGEITGEYNAFPTYRGFVRQGNTSTLYDGDPTRTQTFPPGINFSGTVVGDDCIGFGSCNGFVRDPLGAITSLVVAGASNTEPDGVNDLGTISGVWLDASFNRHGFIAVPTSAQMVLALSATVTTMNITALGTSLTDQLQLVETDLTANNGLACQDLVSFASHVMAQTGKKITMAQANQLLPNVATIEAAIGCGP
jgi:hypothetical protein